MTTFVKSKEILSLIRQSRIYNTTPSALLGVTDSYVGYCLNEACMHIVDGIQEDKTLIFEVEESKSPKEVKGDNQDYINFMQGLDFG